MIRLAMLLAMAFPAGADTVPLAPSGVWSVSFDSGMCILVRPYDKASFGLRRVPLGDTTTILLTGGDGRTFQNGKARMTLLPSGKVIDTTYRGAWLPDRGFRLSTFVVDTPGLAELPKSTAVKIDLAGNEPVTFSLATVGGGLSALRSCEDAVLRQWKIDPAERDRIGTLAEPMNKYWVSQGVDLYPREAIRANEQGASAVVWTVDVDGRASDCRVVASSGSASLDAASCQMISRAGKYRPAKDKEGKPVLSHMTTRINWVLPGGKQR